MPKTLSLLAVLKKIDAKGIKSLSDPQWNTFLASDTEPNEIQAKIAKLEGYEQQGAAYDKTGELILEDNNAMIERFRQRTGRAKGRESLKVKKSKINVKSFKEKFLDKDEEPVKPDTTGASDLVKVDKPPDLSKPDPVEEKETEGLKGIRDVLDDILKVLRLDFKGDRKEARDAQKEAAKDEREKREGKLEGGVKKSLGVIEKAVGSMMKPFSGIWDAIINWIKFTLIGVLFQKTLKWFSDPKNKKKAERIGKFFKDWWPALATAAALFLTPLGALVKGVVGLLTAIIPKIVMAIAANPWAALALVGTGLAVWGVSKLASGGDKKQKSVDKEVDQGGGEDNVRTTTTSEQYTEVAGERFDPDNPTENQKQAIQFKEMQENSRQGMNEGGLVQNFNEGGLVQNFNEGGMVDKEFVYSLKKFNTEKVEKGDEVEKIKTIEKTQGSIKLEDLYENQDQILSQLPEGTTIESIVNGTSDIDAETLYPILQNSDAQMASTAKERAAIMQMMQENNLINSDNTVEGHSNYDHSFNEGGLVQHYNEGGSVTVIDTPKSAQNFVQHFNEGGSPQEGSFENITNTETTTPTENSSDPFSFGKKYVSPEETKEFLAARGMPSMELSDGSVVPNFGKMGADEMMKGVQMVREGMANNPEKIQELDNFMATNPYAQPEELQRVINILVPGSQAQVMDEMGADISASAKMNGGGLVQGFNKGGKVPGSGNTDTVPAMLTPGEFVMSKGAVQKYGTDTMEGMNAAAGGGASSSGSKKNDTVPSMLTPGEFVVSAPAVQKYGVKTLESMNLRGGGNNKPEIKVGANKGGLINNYNTTLMKYKGGGSVEEEELVGEEVSQDIIEIINNTVDKITHLVESSGSEVNNMVTSENKMDPLDIPIPPAVNKTITLPTIPKSTGEIIPAKSNNDVPNFRIPIISHQRSMVLASLGIQDLVGG